MTEPNRRIGVLASGGGSTFEAVQDAIETEEITGIEIAVVVCNNGPENPDARVWERANRLGIDIVQISNKTERTCTLPEINGEPVKGAISFEASKKMMSLADDRGLSMYVGLGFMKKIIGEVLQGIPIANEHPGPLGPDKLTAGKWGTGVQEEVMRQGLEYSGPTMHWMDTRLDEHGMPAYDTGQEIDHKPVKVTNAMRQEWEQNGTVDLLKYEVMRVEKLWVPSWIVKAAEQINVSA